MLTIAHRLHTVLNSDKILVIDAGTVVEFDHPHKLLQNINGFFYGMVQQTGMTTARLLHHIASEVLIIVIRLVFIKQSTI